jgi:hypothetical protein
MATPAVGGKAANNRTGFAAAHSPGGSAEAGDAQVKFEPFERVVGSRAVTNFAVAI